MTTLSFNANKAELQHIIKTFDLDSFSTLSLGTQLKSKLIEYDQTEAIEKRIKKQQYLKLCLQNWQALKYSGHIMEEAKAILLGNKHLSEPSIQQLFFVQDFYCTECKHYHANSEPHVCKNINCNCGLRG